MKEGNLDLVDINIRAQIAFGIAVIALILLYVVFFR